MFEFGIYVLILLLMALGFVVVPLLLAKTVERKTDDAVNIELAQNKLQELKADLAAGNLTQAQFAEAKQELEVGLYHDLHDGAAQQTSGNGRWLIVPLLFIVPVLSLGLYSQLGDFRAFEPQPEAAAEAGADPSGQINAMVATLEQRLQQQPDDLKGWLILGRSYKAIKRYDDAVIALRKAQALQGNNADILLQLADAVAGASGGSMQGEPAELVEQALKLQPDNEIGLWLSGMSKAEVGQYDEAVALWRKLQQRYQPGQPDYQELQDVINTALERSGKQPEAQQAVSAQAAAVASPMVNVQVTLGEQFKASVKADDSVMVYVKAVNGPKMPLAAVKRQVKDLPLTISFDDSMAMMPTMKISSVDEVIVTARVSRSGNAMPTAGEPIGTAKVMGEQRQDVKIVIDQQVP